MRLNLFLPFLRRARKDPARELPRPVRRIALNVLPAQIFSDTATGSRVSPGLLRRTLKKIGPTWLSSPVRRCVQTICFIAFLWLFFYVCWPYGTQDYAATLAQKEKLPATTFLALDPLVSLTTALAAKAWVWSLLWALGILLACVLFPRGFCGYLCPLGTLIDLFDWALGKRINLFKVKHDGWWVHLKYFILLGVLISSVLGVLLSGFVAAIPVLTRGFLFTLAPLQMGVHRGFYQVPPMGWGEVFSIVLFLVVLGLGLLRPRFWCRYVCPTGAVFSAANVLRAAERKVEDTCINCNLCVEICPFDAIKADFTTRTDDCTLCQTCGGVCPTHAIKFVDRWENSHLKKEGEPETRELPMTRRGMLVGVAAGIAAAATVGLSSRRAGAAPPIRPPGSVPEDEFLQLCIRCGECFKACPNNVLQPMGLATGLNNLWTPQAVPTWSGCEPSCNNCGQVCPTGAIRALPIPEKRVARMGLAIINETTCLPYAGREACQLCVDECIAAGYDAIEFERVGTQLDQLGDPIEGSGFLAPVMVPDKCVGCGLCQTRCHNTNVTAKHLLHDSAIIVHAGKGKEDRISTGSYIQLRIERQKVIEAQVYPDAPYTTDF
ncbi:MAG: 4Fe-4S binding protein [Phycisphaeraceae bacterium]